MDASAEPDVLSISARHRRIGQLNEDLRQVSSATKLIKIIGCHGLDFVAAGLAYNGRISIDNHLGDYGFSCVSNVEVELVGNVGSGLGEGMESGSITVHGNAVDGVGAFNRGGLIVIHGHTGRRTGVGMNGGDIIVKGSIGAQGGMGMKAGGLMILGEAGPMLGYGMTGGTIYVRGEVASIASHIEEYRVREADRLRISLLFLKSGIEGDACGIRAYRAVEP